VNVRYTILVALAAVVIFAAGVVTGGLLVQQTRPRPTPPGGIPFLGRVEAIGRTVNQLDLSPEQRKRITEIVRNGRERIADYFVILEPDIQQVFRELRQQIQAELTPAQRTEFEELFRKRQQRLPDRRSGPPGNFPSSPEN
jgi:Spy/CpxP family protein refolding chaperone